MILVSVMYPGGAEPAAFDLDYYLKHHMPLVRERWSPLGLEKAEVVKAAATPDGSPPPFQIIALLTFRSLEDFQKAAATHGPEIFADIPNFTQAKPVIQINQPQAW
ncbi:EthD family reductase [Methylobacterium sp. ID0610]|uniref:EthD family reductase n=1 Tax=Methylobacterium carpenticola TaxID=3344827 RepID=UPI0036C12A2D